ncbi:unnamed protein product, partial [Symbiodinium sp. KB8]
VVPPSVEEATAALRVPMPLKMEAEQQVARAAKIPPLSAEESRTILKRIRECDLSAIAEAAERAEDDDSCIRLITTGLSGALVQPLRRGTTGALALLAQVARRSMEMAAGGAQHKTVAESLMTSDGLQPLVDAITLPDIRKASLAAEARPKNIAPSTRNIYLGQGVCSAMVDRFDPNLLVLDLLRRIANSHAQRPPAAGPGCFTRCLQELQMWFQETALGSLLRRLKETSAGSAQDSAVGEGSEHGESRGREPAELSEPSADPHETPPTPPVSRGSGNGSPKSGGGQEGPPKRAGFPSQALRQHLREGLKQLKVDIEVMLFLSFPSDSPFIDPTVESLFQWHYTRRSWVCMDWSALATLLMLCWDIAMNPPYRVLLVLLFYTAFGAGLIIRKLLMFASPSAPGAWRVWHNVLLCAFFFGRCVICQPLLVSLATDGSTQLQAVQVEAFSSVIGLGMTNISMVFMQQMQTVDTLLFCFVNGAVFILWIVFVLQMPLTDALHTAYVGSIVITAVCVRQQRDLEELDRRSFDHQLLNARGTLVRSAEQLSRQSTAQEFSWQMRILENSRSVEHLNF